MIPFLFFFIIIFLPSPSNRLIHPSTAMATYHKTEGF